MKSSVNKLYLKTCFVATGTEIFIFCFFKMRLSNVNKSWNKHEEDSRSTITEKRLPTFCLYETNPSKCFYFMVEHRHRQNSWKI